MYKRQEECFKALNTLLEEVDAAVGIIQSLTDLCFLGILLGGKKCYPRQERIMVLRVLLLQNIQVALQGLEVWLERGCCLGQRGEVICNLTCLGLCLSQPFIYLSISGLLCLLDAMHVLLHLEPAGAQAIELLLV